MPRARVAVWARAADRHAFASGAAEIHALFQAGGSFLLGVLNGASPHPALRSVSPEPIRTGHVPASGLRSSGPRGPMLPLFGAVNGVPGYEPCDGAPGTQRDS